MAHPNDSYTIQFNSEFAYQRYTEFDGVNRVSQQLINNGTYLTGGPVPGPAGSPLSFPTEILLNPTAVPLPGKADIDGSKGDGADAIRYNAQLINTYEIADGITLTKLPSPIETTQSGRIDLAESEFVPQYIVNNGGYYQAPVIPGQYTLNATVYYDFGRYQIRLSGYNIINQHNLFNDYAFTATTSSRG